MHKLLLLFVILSITSCNITKGLIDSLDPSLTPFEKDNNYSASYEEVIEYYEYLDKTSLYIQVNAFGKTDSGHPLHEVIIDKSKKFTPLAAIQENKAVMFFNN